MSYQEKIVYSRTPLRVSFFGGGSDYPEYYNRFRGSVIGTTINKYIYICSLPLSHFGKNNFSLSYRNSESVKNVSEIKHPVFKAVLKNEFNNYRYQFSVMADLPGGTGLGSSSSFTVGLLNLINSIKKIPITRYELAKKAIHYEKNILKENVGIQDQMHASFGGLNRFNFDKYDFNIAPVRYSENIGKLLNEALILVYTGIERSSSKVLKTQISNTKKGNLDSQLKMLVSLVDEANSLLESKKSNMFLRDFGKLLTESWKYKKSVSSQHNSKLDDIFNFALKSGVYGGKLCGAGHGGFFVFLANKISQKKLIEKYKHKCLKISMEATGSQILY